MVAVATAAATATAAAAPPGNASLYNCCPASNPADLAASSAIVCCIAFCSCLAQLYVYDPGTHCKGMGTLHPASAMSVLLLFMWAFLYSCFLRYSVLRDLLQLPVLLLLLPLTQWLADSIIAFVDASLHTTAVLHPTLPV